MVPWWFWFFPGAILVGIAGIPLFGWWLKRYDDRVVRKNRAKR